jgi:transmembrane sensor
VGQQLTVDLPDGSVMELNSNSLARLDYRAHRRTIHLVRGEAFFKVVHDSGRPFRVSAPEGWVQDVGTQFDVYLRETNLRITVSEGVVEVGASSGSPANARPDAATAVLVTGGQQADVASGHTLKRTLSPEQLAEATAWRSGTVFFEDTPLEDVVAQLNRYAVTKIVLEDGALRALRVGGTFQANPNGSASLLRMLERNFGVRERRDDGRVYLRGPLQK